MPTYDPTGHPELSAEAKALSSEALTAKADRAEAVLDIAGTAYAGADAEKLRLAVALQVNRTLRLEARGGGSADVVQEEKGDQSITYAKHKDGTPITVDPEALKLVADVKAAGDSPALPPPPVSTTTGITFGW